MIDKHGVNQRWQSVHIKLEFLHTSARLCEPENRPWVAQI